MEFVVERKFDKICFESSKILFYYLIRKFPRGCHGLSINDIQFSDYHLLSALSKTFTRDLLYRVKSTFNDVIDLQGHYRVVDN